MSDLSPFNQDVGVRLPAAIWVDGGLSPDQQPPKVGLQRAAVVLHNASWELGAKHHSGGLSPWGWGKRWYIITTDEENVLSFECMNAVYVLTLRSWPLCITLAEERSRRLLVKGLYFWFCFRFCHIQGSLFQSCSTFCCCFLLLIMNLYLVRTKKLLPNICFVLGEVIMMFLRAYMSLCRIELQIHVVWIWHLCL